MLIRPIQPLPYDIPHGILEYLDAFVGLTVEANSQAAQAIRSARPDIPPRRNGHFDVAIGDALEALTLARPPRIEAFTYWGKLQEKVPIISFPIDCIEMVTPTDDRNHPK